MEKRIQQMMSDILNVTMTKSGGAADKGKMYLSDFEGQTLTKDDIDIVLCNRLAKNCDENKFIYLTQCFERLE
jgi:hypothetical protein